MSKRIHYLDNLTLLVKLSYRIFNAINTSGSYHRFVNRLARDTIHKSQILNDGTIPERVYHGKRRCCYPFMFSHLTSNK